MELPVTLRPVDSLDVTIVVDNSIDILLAGDERVRRAPLHPDWSTREQLIAEHGYAALLRFRRGGEERTVLYDAGLGRDTAVHNLRVLGVYVKGIEAIVLSHGHADHHSGLEGLIRAVGRKGLPLVLHPDAWRMRKVVFPSGAEIAMPPPDRRALERADVRVVEGRGPSMLLGDGVLVTGQVERATDFERGFPWQHARTAGGWEPDPWIWDDQGVVCHVKGRGLVVVSSCSHAGVINVVRNAARVTGMPKVHRFVGGLHLTRARSSRSSRGRSRRSRGSRRTSSCPGTAWRGGRRTRSRGGWPGRTSRRAWGRRCGSGDSRHGPNPSSRLPQVLHFWDS